PPPSAGAPLPRSAAAARGGARGDLNCEDPSRDYFLEWPKILANVESLLAAWARGGGDVEGSLVAFVEDLASRLNIDRAWPIFKAMGRSQCPLGTACVAAVLAWRCRSPWAGDPRGPSTERLFDAMLRQLPLLDLQPGDPPRPAAPARASPQLGCDAMLTRHLQELLRAVPLADALRSRWPVFELLSALHTENRAWPRGYP
ncbi:unnamed protein product, partial [Prorocentrum cordatum]